MSDLSQTPPPLISAAELRAELGRPHPPLLLDCRFLLQDPAAGEAAYQAGHLPGAVYAHLERDLSGPRQPGGAGGRHPLPDPAVLGAWLGALGIGGETLVVAYDDPSSGQGFYAARAWWLLRWLGHGAVRVLDGGLPAWVAAGGQLTAEVPTPAPASFVPRPRPDWVASAAEVAALPGGTVLLDSRAGPRYRGEVEPLDPKAGHIPGAVNRDWAGALDHTGHWLSGEVQAARLGLDERPAVLYCGSGVSASANLLALALAGRAPGPQTRLYAGSWSDWVSDEGRAVATGEE